MIHPTAVIGEPPEHRDFPTDTSWRGHYPHIRRSARVEALCTVDAGMDGPTRIGRRTWLMKGVHVGHDAEIGDDCELAPHCSVGGHVTIGNRVRAGQGVLFKPFVAVGNDARIGMGAVVIHDVPAGETWAGNPARRIHSKTTGEVLTESEMEGWETIAARINS